MQNREIKHRPILFRSEMVQAIIAGRKTMTRRIVKPQPNQKATELIKSGQWKNEPWVAHFPYDPKKNNGLQIFEVTNTYKCPYGNIGDVIWIRETWQITDFLHPSDENYGYIYKASDDGKEWESTDENWKWRPSIFMPKSACRIFLEITEVKAERLQDISEEDVIQEGIEQEFDTFLNYQEKNKIGSFYLSAKNSFKSLWQKINGQKSWNENYCVWCISFKRIDKPKNFYVPDSNEKVKITI